MNPCLIFAAVVIGLSVAIYLSKTFIIEDESYFHVNVNPKEIFFETDEKYLSVALDISFMRCYFHKFNDGDWKKLEKLSRLLSPAYLRFGGNDADRTFFNFSSAGDEQFLKNSSCEDFSSEDALVISGEDWIKLNTFAQKSRLNLIIDLNVLIRKGSKWDSSNAEALIKFSEKNGFPLDFQLGNEPNEFPRVFSVEITGSQLAEDFIELRKLLNSTTIYNKSKLIGPDVTRPKHFGMSSLTYLSDFLSKKDVVDAVSWHQYYLNGRNATVDEFIDPRTFDLLQPQINAVSKTVRKFYPTAPIWLSETGSAYGGGAPELSNRFVASFLWLDKLGTAARSNISLVARQSLFKGNYALISDSFTPSPDFWISVLFKQLVGPQVLDVKVDDQKPELLKFYGHCLSRDAPLDGNIVIYGLNLSNQTQVFVPSGLNIVYPVYSFIFTAEFNDLTAETVLLNGRELIYNESEVPDMLQMANNVKYPLGLPSYAIGFWVLKEETETACEG